MPVPVTNATVAGNVVALKIAPARFAFYAHLQPRSIRVRPGQRVKKGPGLGLLGNSGNSVGPHLHFHVGTENDLNATVAAPYVFERFHVLGPGPRAHSSRS